jgi:hypothetical protein
MGQWMTGFDGNPLYVLAPGEQHPDPSVRSAPVDAHSQMLAARVEGLEKDINGLQHVWTRVRVLESKVETLESAKVVPADVTYNLLRRCLVALPVTSDLAKDITEFLRNR